MSSSSCRSPTRSGPRSSRWSRRRGGRGRARRTWLLSDWERGYQQVADINPFELLNSPVQELSIANANPKQLRNEKLRSSSTSFSPPAPSYSTGWTTVLALSSFFVLDMVWDEMGERLCLGLLAFYIETRARKCSALAPIRPYQRVLSAYRSAKREAQKPLVGRVRARSLRVASAAEEYWIPRSVSASDVPILISG